MKKFLRRLLAAGIGGCIGTAAAAEKVPTLADILKASEIAVNGYIDTSYTHLSGAGMFTSTVPNRVYDRERNSFNLHTVDVSVGYQPAKGFGGFVQVDMGSDADVSASVGTGAADQVDVQEAYAQYANGAFTFMGGKFATLAGAEVIESPSNTNFSRSILFGYAIPFTHTGVRAAYALSDSTKFYLGVNNGWDVVRKSVAGNTDKTLEVGVSSTPVKPLTLAANFYSGKEVAAANGTRDVVDLVATYNVTDALSFVLNFDSGSQENAVTVGSKAKWNGLAAYVNYKLSDLWRVSLRAEDFDDKDGFRTGVVQKWKETTLTLAHMPSKNVELRGEVRYDKSNVSSFLEAGGGTKSSQDSFALEAIYKF